jgi:hypothetical protein
MQQARCSVLTAATQRSNSTIVNNSLNGFILFGESFMVSGTPLLQMEQIDKRFPGVSL